MTVDLGIQGLSVERGSHICAFYSGDFERTEILVPFVKEAMRAGDRCICLVDLAEAETIEQALEAETSKRGDIDESWLMMQPAVQSYLVNGRFDSDHMLAFWVSTFEDAMARGWPFVRIISEASWTIRDIPGINEFMVYEAKYNEISRPYPHVTVCLYDFDVFGPEMLIAILKTHPFVLVGGVVHENPDYMQPDEFRASREHGLLG